MSALSLCQQLALTVQLLKRSTKILTTLLCFLSCTDTYGPKCTLVANCEHCNKALSSFSHHCSLDLSSMVVM